MARISRPLSVIVPIGAIVLVSIVLALGLGAVALKTGDDYAIGRQRDLLGNAFRSAAEQIGRELMPQVYWQDAFEQVRAQNLDWMKDNLGSYLSDTFGFSRAYVLDPDDRPIAAFENGSVVPPSAFAAVAPTLMSLVREIRRPAEMAPANVGRIAQARVAQDGTKLSLVIVGR